jgi:hypothetical protein
VPDSNKPESRVKRYTRWVRNEAVGDEQSRYRPDEPLVRFGAENGFKASHVDQWPQAVDHVEGSLEAGHSCREGGIVGFDEISQYMGFPSLNLGADFNARNDFNG